MYIQTFSPFSWKTMCVYMYIYIISYMYIYIYNCISSQIMFIKKTVISCFTAKLFFLWWFQDLSNLGDNCGGFQDLFQLSQHSARKQLPGNSISRVMKKRDSISIMDDNSVDHQDFVGHMPSLSASPRCFFFFQTIWAGFS